MPTVDELATLADPTQINPAWPDGHPFTNVKSSYYWSSTTHAGNTSYAWYVFFGSGDAYAYYKSNSHYVRAVRSGQ